MNYSIKNEIIYWIVGLPGDASGKEPACQLRRPERHRFDPWVGKMPWRRAWQSTPYPCLENLMDRGAWRAKSTGLQRVGHDWVTNTFVSFITLGSPNKPGLGVQSASSLKGPFNSTDPQGRGITLMAGIWKWGVHFGCYKDWVGVMSI